MRRKNTTAEMMKSYMADSLLMLMEKKDYANISIGEITEKAGVNRSTYYRNFKSKEGIIRFYFTRLMETYLIQTKPDMDMKAYLRGMFHTFLAQKKQVMLIHRQGISYLLADTLNDYFLERIAPKKQCSFSEKFAIYYHTGGIFNTFMLWFSNDMDPSPEELAELSLSVKNAGLRRML